MGTQQQNHFHFTTLHPDKLVSRERERERELINGSILAKIRARTFKFPVKKIIETFNFMNFHHIRVNPRAMWATIIFQ